MKKVKYDVRKNFADSRLRGRFVQKEDEQLLRELLIEKDSVFADGVGRRGGDYSPWLQCELPRVVKESRCSPHCCC
jgi:hypothetical protein